MERFFDKGREEVKIFTRISLAFIVLIFNSGTAFSQNCDALVIDEAGIFGSRGIGPVTEAAKKVQNLGAEVRIRTFSRGTNLDFVQDEFEKSCQSWRATDGGTRNNLISMLMAVDDRQFGFYAGSQWASALNRSRQNQIENDYIFPRFRDGDFSGAFVAGLDQIGRLIEAQNSGALTVPSNNSSPVIVQTEPTDLTGLWWVLSAIVLLGLIVGGYIAYDRKRKENERRRAAQQKALMAKREVSASINSVSDSLPKLEAMIAALSGSLSKEELSALDGDLGKIRQAIDSVSESFSRIGTGKSDAEGNDLTAQEYGNIEAEYRKLASSVKPTTELENKLAHLAKLSKELAGSIEELRNHLTGVDEAAKRIEAQGFKTEAARVILNEAYQKYEMARDAYKAKSLSKAEAAARTAKVTADSALSLANSLPQRKSKINVEVVALRTRIRGTDALIDEGHEIFTRISKEYAESCWESVNGNGVEAEERLQSSQEAVEEAVSLASMENQKWDGADQLVQETNKRLDEAESLMRSITALEKNLQAAKRDSQKEIDAARVDIEKANKYIREYDNDISEERDRELDEAENLFSEASIELRQDKPDYLRVVKLAQQANFNADKILENSRSEHEAMERLRQKASSSVRDAKAAYSKAKEYIEDHSSDVDSDAEGDLKQAVAYLTALDSVTDLNKKVEVANQVEKSAENAYKKAKKDVDDAEEERARRRRAATAASSISHSSRSSSSSSSFGSSRSWGSSGGSSFGGSRSVGSSGRIGGSRSW